ncbi:MAG: DUF2071 domain-containing protein [Bacteroidota bacterium]
MTSPNVTLFNSGLDATAHRPWPLPSSPWAISMRWASLAFLHWPMPASALRPLVPASLEIDTFEGEAWIGVVPFRMERTKLRGLPLVPGTHTFGEFNVRTYVRHGPTGRAGVWFFSLDAASFLAVWAARVGFGLPYFNAEIIVARDNIVTEDTGPAKATDVAPLAVRYVSRRRHRGAPDAAFRATVAPANSRVVAGPGSLTHWFTERYALFATRLGKLITGDIYHRPWPLRPAEARIETNTLVSAWGMDLPDIEPWVHYADTVDVVAWAPRVLR